LITPEAKLEPTWAFNMIASFLFFDYFPAASAFFVAFW